MASLHIETWEEQPAPSTSATPSLISDREKVQTLLLVRNRLQNVDETDLPPETLARHIRMLQLAERALFVAIVEASYPEEG